MPETWRLWATLALTWLAAGSTSGRSLGHGVTSHSERTSLMLPEICSRNPFGTRRFSLQQGENGTLVAKNLDVNRIDPLSRSYYSLTPAYDGASPKKRICSVELFSCPSCSIVINFKALNLSPCFSNINNNYNYDYDYNNYFNNHNKSSCNGCDYIAVKENYYTTPMVLCGSDRPLPIQYQSIGRSITLSFVFNHNYDYAFLLEYAAVLNSRVVTGKTGDQGTIQSPHFPTSYTRDYSNEIKLQNLEPSATSSIQLVFDDFQLGSLSFIEVLNANNTRVYTLSGNLQFRPPILVINGSQVTLRFNVNAGRGLGYQATYTFLNQTADQIEIPATDCGGIVDNIGGVITMANMSSPGVAGKLFDCIWLVKPYMEHQYKAHLLVRIEQLTNLEWNGTLQVRQGLTSQAPLVETLTGDSKMASEYLIPADIGFYIRLRGRLSSEFIMAIAYSAFSYTECYSMRNFMCLNHRCISSQLRCDGFNHCGDNSDEETACISSSVSPQDPSWWYTHTPKYYFPKSSEYREFAAPTFIFLAATLGLGVLAFIVSILTLLYRMTSHTDISTRERQARMDFLRSQLANESTEIIENPPSYEAPPDYAEIFKANEPAKEVVNMRQDEGLQVLIPPTPTPTITTTPGKRRRERRSDRHLRSAPGSRNASPVGSRSPTPRRLKKSSGIQRSGSSAALSNRNSPPPPYVYDPCVGASHSSYTNQLTVPTADVSIPNTVDVSVDVETLWNQQETSVASNMQEVSTECGCPGACSCQTINCELTDSNSLLISPKVTDDEANDAGEPQTNERRGGNKFKSKFSSFRASDPPLHRLAMTQNSPWNKSM